MKEFALKIRGILVAIEMSTDLVDIRLLCKQLEDVTNQMHPPARTLERSYPRNQADTEVVNDR